MEIDKWELQEQRKQEILDSGKYVRVEIIVPNMDFEDGTEIIPYSKTEINSNIFTQWVLIKTMEAYIENFKKMKPEIGLCDIVAGCKSSVVETIKKGDTEEIKE